MHIDATAGGSGSHYIRGLFMSAPSTPYSVIGLLAPLFVNYGALANFGITFRESATNKLAYLATPNITTVEYWNHETSSASTPYSNANWQGERAKWVKIRDDGTNLSFHMSSNGIDWQQLLSASRTAHFTSGPNQVGVIVNRGNSVTNLVHLDVLHWSFE
jgi:hypothetical protein